MGMGVGAGDAYTDAMAVAALDDFLKTHRVSRITTASATGAFALYLRMTTLVIPAGNYGLSINAISGGPGVSAGSQVEFNIDLDSGAFIGEGALESYGVSGGRFTDSSVELALLPVAEGIHTVDFLFRQPAGPGTAAMIQLQMQLQTLRPSLI